MVKDDPLMAEMMEEGMAGMQKSFGSFAAAMGGEGRCICPTAFKSTTCHASKCPLAELMADATGEDRELMERAEKDGHWRERRISPRHGQVSNGDLAYGGQDPHFWSDDDDDEDEDAWLDDLQNGLQAKEWKRRRRQSCCCCKEAAGQITRSASDVLRLRQCKAEQWIVAAPRRRRR